MPRRAKAVAALVVTAGMLESERMDALARELRKPRVEAVAFLLDAIAKVSAASWNWHILDGNTLRILRDSGWYPSTRWWKLYRCGCRAASAVFEAEKIGAAKRQKSCRRNKAEQRADRLERRRKQRAARRKKKTLQLPAKPDRRASRPSRPAGRPLPVAMPVAPPISAPAAPVAPPRSGWAAAIWSELQSKRAKGVVRPSALDAAALEPLLADQCQGDAELFRRCATVFLGSSKYRSKTAKVFAAFFEECMLTAARQATAGYLPADETETPAAPISTPQAPPPPEKLRLPEDVVAEQLCDALRVVFPAWEVPLYNLQRLARTALAWPETTRIEKFRAIARAYERDLSGAAPDPRKLEKLVSSGGNK